MSSTLTIRYPYSAKETKGKWGYESSKAILKCSTYPHMVMWAADRLPL